MERAASNVRWSGLAALALIAGEGCIATTESLTSPSPTKPALYAAPADRVQTSMLLNFDDPLDSTFVDAPAINFSDDPTHAGNHVLAVDRSVRLNLTALTLGRGVGAAWDVFGLRVWSEAATTCDITVIGPPTSPAYPRRFSLAAHAWTTLWMDAPKLSGVRPASTSTSTQLSDGTADRFLVVFSQSVPTGRLLIDDVMLARSEATVSDSRVPKTNEHWHVARRGLQWIAAVNDVAIFTLPAAPFVPGGYLVMESDPTRALFTNDSGTTVCIDRTGRLIEDGRAKLNARVLKFAKAIAENASPALIEIIDGQGRIERSLPGDRDNDGYDERRGCYTVRAVAGRVNLRLTKQGATVKWPALEIYDLPPGAVNVWLDGDIVPWAVRAEDGRVIVELPIELERPVEVQIRVK